MKKTMIIGSVHADLVAYVESLPKGNEDITPVRTEMRMGGSGWKNAYLLSKIGFPYELPAPVGSGVYGEYVEEQAKANGIELSVLTEDIAGVMYCMVDRKGNKSYFCVPGTEYDFSIDYVRDTEPEDFSSIILYGDMLQGEGQADVVEVLETIDKPVYFAPGAAADSLDDDVLDALMSFCPVLHLTDTDAFYLMQEECTDLKETAERIHKASNNDVLILKNGEGCYYCGREESFLAPETRDMDADLHLAMYACCVEAGVDIRNSMMNANRFAADYKDKLPGDREIEFEKHRIAEMIMMK